MICFDNMTRVERIGSLYSEKAWKIAIHKWKRAIWISGFNLGFGKSTNIQAECISYIFKGIIFENGFSARTKWLKKVQLSFKPFIHAWGSFFVNLLILFFMRWWYFINTLWRMASLDCKVLACENTKDFWSLILII